MFFRQSTPLKLSDKKSIIPSIDGVQFRPIEVMRKDLIVSSVGTVSLASSGIDGEGFGGHDADAVATIFPIMKFKC